MDHTATAPHPLLVMRGITKSFPGVKALRGVDLEVPAGHVLGLVGENGAGKSTLVKILSGAYVADDGSISVDGNELASGTSEAIEAGIAVIYQELSLVDDMSIAENLFLGRMPSRGGFLHRRDAHSRATEALEQVGLGHLDPRGRLGDLPLNARQLVEVAKALVREAGILVMDEPTAALQSEDIANLYAVVRRLRKSGLALVFISHHLEEVFELADSALVLRDGQAVEWRPIGEWDEPSMVRAMVARDLDAFFPWQERTYGETVLEVKDMRRPPILNHASFTVRAGEIVGIGGIAGAGRTELLKAISGAEPAVEGSISVGGRRIRASSPTVALANGIVYTAEDRKLEGLVLGASIGENVALSNLQGISTAGFVSEKRKRSLGRRAIERFSVRASSVAQVTGLLSGGNQQKVILARAVATTPKVILLDEPTRGIDIGAKAEIYRHIIDMATQGVAVVMVSSELPELLGMTDRVLVMYRGRIVVDLPRSETTSETVIHWATTGVEPS